MGLHTPTIIVSSGNDFLQTATSYVLARSLYELHGFCCSPFRKYLLFGEISGLYLDVDVQLFSLCRTLTSHSKHLLSQDEVKYNHQTLSRCIIKISYFISSFFLAVCPQTLKDDIQIAIWGEMFPAQNREEETT